MSKLTQYLNDTGETQGAFADRVGVTQGTISKICRGKTPSLRLACDIEKATGGVVRAGEWLQCSDSEANSENEGVCRGHILQGHTVEKVRGDVA